MMPFLKSLSALLDEVPGEMLGATAATCCKPAMTSCPKARGCTGCHFAFPAGRLQPPAGNDDIEYKNTAKTVD